ncbi:DUF6635 family protein [Lacibacterium aquatile]|uniref:DUF6635 family protein n=1 Tax=Lacibacterium aquatile TaxID=1168082 RepID=A0ABW5DMV6_9PROT
MTTELPPLESNLPVALDRQTLARVVDDGVKRYFEDRRQRVPEFIDRHFSWRGARRLHRHALGWDIAKAPVNLALAGPNLAIRAGALALRRMKREGLAERLDKIDLTLATDVGREVEWLLVTDLLELPYKQGERQSTHDALADTILSDPRIETFLRSQFAALDAAASDPAFRTRATELIGAYVGARGATADIATSIFTLAAGAATVRQFTPGVVSLGPALAGALAQKMAIAGFPLGAGIGGAWYGIFPAAAGPALTLGMTGGLAAVASALAAFSGMVIDPIMAGTGLHRRRLTSMLTSLEQEIAGGDRASLPLTDHYLARLADMLDLMRALTRLGG